MAAEFQPPPTWADPMLEIEDPRTKEKKVVFNPVWLKWFVDLTALLAPAGAGSGTVTSITAGTGLTGGTIVLAGTIALIPALSVTVTTAKLTAGGANGSMTFTSGLLTAQTPAT